MSEAKNVFVYIGPEKAASSDAVNVSYSALMIYVTIILNKLNHFLKLGREGVATKRQSLPSRLFGMLENRLSKHDSDDLPFSQALRRSKKINMPIIFLRRIFIKTMDLFSYRRFVQRVFDRVVCIDWDIFDDGMKEDLRRYYSDKNAPLAAYIKNKDTRSKYIDA
jgi:hypothetical protein